ncbi:MAG TPA: lactococcin 972 family bacteriocin [Actinomycetaceae bacterium]|nr:lactococcin 972 family bacteriocin [Actinomycetaceae bacterium]
MASGGAISPDDTDVTVSDIVPEGTITPFTVQNVGGGTWNYGSYLNIWPPKTCYSNYVHNTRYRSSTAIISASDVKQYANAGNWSNASTWAGAAYTCYTYWATY